MSGVTCRYNVDYTYSGINHWGLGVGCLIVDSHTSDQDRGSALRQYSCSRTADGAAATPSAGDLVARNSTQTLRCSVDRTSRGFCVVTESHDGFNHVAVRTLHAFLAPVGASDGP